MQKGFVPILLVIALVVVTGFGVYFGKPIIDKFFFKSQVTVPSSDKKTELSELNGFPVYPTTIFVESGINQTCNQEQQIKGLEVCNNKYYQWVTTDNFDQVRDWYAEATQKSGWICSGGAGQYTSPRDASGFGTNCIKDGLDPYELSYDASSESTKITLDILKLPTDSEQIDETANWKTYANNNYGYTFRFPPTWRDLTNSRETDKNFTIESEDGERVYGTIFKGGIDPTQESKNQGFTKSFQLKNDVYLFVSYVECDGPGCNFGKKHIDTFNQILSTFKFLP